MQPSVHQTAAFSKGRCQFCTISQRKSSHRRRHGPWENNSGNKLNHKSTVKHVLYNTKTLKHQFTTPQFTANPDLSSQTSFNILIIS